MKTKFIQTRINEDVFLKLKEKAEIEERSLSSLIRIIIKYYLGYDVPAPTRKDI
jgi:hypothetical protein